MQYVAFGDVFLVSSPPSHLISAEHEMCSTVFIVSNTSIRRQSDAVGRASYSSTLCAVASYVPRYCIVVVS